MIAHAGRTSLRGALAIYAQATAPENTSWIQISALDIGTNWHREEIRLKGTLQNLSNGSKKPRICGAFSMGGDGLEPPASHL